jgi:exopolysaccharide production protein ExoY
LCFVFLDLGDVMAHFPDLAPEEFSGARTVPAGLYRRFLKRGLDLVVALMLAPIVLPLTLLLGLMIRGDGGPALYSQPRIGRGGRVFRCWKLRTMQVDADRRLADLIAADPLAHAEWTSRQKLKNDPRITRLGRVLRKTSLDELPQLWNVLMGDMSLVGPRPMLPDQAGLYRGRAYYSLRPGLTGLWQISDRNETSFGDRARFDNEYSRRLSFATDVMVLLATAWVVVRGTGY